MLRSILSRLIAKVAPMRQRAEAAIAMLPARTPAPPPPPVIVVETFGSYAEKWLVRRVAQGFRSKLDTRSVLDVHILPVLGARPILEITTRELRDFMTAVQAKKCESKDKVLAPRTVRNVYATTRNILATAESDEVIPKNPCKLRCADLPKNDDASVDWREKAKFSAEEMRIIIDLESKNNPSIDRQWRALYRFLAFTGLRIGEASALTWDFIELDKKPLGKISVQKSYSSKNKVVGPTKTKVGRVVPVHEHLAPHLRAWRDTGWRETFGREPLETDIVFPALVLRGSAQRSVGAP